MYARVRKTSTSFDWSIPRLISLLRSVFKRSASTHVLTPASLSASFSCSTRSWVERPQLSLSHAWLRKQSYTRRPGLTKSTSVVRNVGSRCISASKASRARSVPLAYP
eukprot:2744540-Prymnesium_polylepis.1